MLLLQDRSKKDSRSPERDNDVMKRLLGCCIIIFLASAAVGGKASAATSPSQQLIGKLQWRSIGPYHRRALGRRRRRCEPAESLLLGGVEGGVWKSTDYGRVGRTSPTERFPAVADPIGALAVAPSNPNVIYAGTGEADIRGDFDTGDGIYKSTNAGKTWSYAGLRDTHMIAKLAIDPHDPNIVYAASMGHVFKPNAERGIFKTTDGGKTWRKVLFVDENTGGVDLVDGSA